MRFALPRMAAAGLLAWLFCCALGAPVRAEGVIDPAVVERVLKRADGQLESIETEYNNIFIAKRGSYVGMSFRRFGKDYTESVSNLGDWTELPIAYTQVMTVGLAYPEGTPKRVLSIGLGGGSLTSYLAGYLAELEIDNVELDPGVIAAAKKYFGLKERAGVRYIAADGRVFLMREKTAYDVILVDAFRGGYVPFHLLTQEFYQHLARRLAPKGVAVFNLHQGTKLFDSTLKTLSTVFPGIDVYGTGGGNVIVVAGAEARREQASLIAQARALQERYGFRYALPRLLDGRNAAPTIPVADILTDDFAPTEVYDKITKNNERRW